MAEEKITLPGRLTSWKGHLLLIHGTMDNNVPPYNTLLVVNELIKANKDFDLLLLPNRAHGFGNEPYMVRRRWDYFVKNLLGAEPPKEFGVRSTGKYWATSMPGVWARSPYLHNGSVRTMEDLLTPPNERAKTFHRGSRVYDPAHTGFTDEGAYLFDTAGPGNSNIGHEYGTTLAAEQKRDLMEYLKTL